MTKIYMMTGLPGSGKSSWANDLVALHGGGMVRVNLDDIRSMLGFGHKGPLPWNKELEKTALELQDKAILSAVKMGKDVIVDNTHLVPTIPKRIKALFDGEVTFIIQDFTKVSVDTCIIRDFVRGENGGRSVGEEVIRTMAKQLNKPWRLTADFMNDYEFPLIPYEPHITDDEPPLAVVFDIDGTLARHHRSPYDYSRLSTDSVFENTKSILKMYWDAHYTVFIVSGRPGTDQIRADTIQWLSRHGIPYDHLFMRKPNDTRNDADVKQEIFETEFRNQYDIENWFDDRDRVVRRLRKLGVNVVQVAYGDF